MYSTDPEIQRQSENVRAALLVYFERNPDMKSPYDGMCYVASATLKKLVGNQVRLWKDHKIIKPGNFSGNYIHYGVREHAMCGIMNGIALHSSLIP